MKQQLLLCLTIQSFLAQNKARFCEVPNSIVNTIKEISSQKEKFCLNLFFGALPQTTQVHTN